MVRVWEGLPPGWIEDVIVRDGKSFQVYIEEETGGQLYTKSQVLQYLQVKNLNKLQVVAQHKEEINGDNSATLDIPQQCEPVEEIRSKPSSETDKEKIDELDELPPGWTKEIKKRKYIGGFVKDTFYTDPVSGYVFRSKKDVARYLQTGNIRKCAVKPRKKDMSAIPAPTPTKENFGEDLKAVHDNAVISQTHISREEKDNTYAPSLPNDTDSRTASDELRHGWFKLHSSRNHTGAVVENTPPSATKENIESRIGDFAKDFKAIGDNGVGSHGPAANLVEGKLPKNSSGPDSETNLGSSKRKSIDLPSRTSKKLVVLEPDGLPSSGLTRQSTHASASVPQNLETNAEINPSSRGDLWSDPCYNFAIRTLKGELPIEDPAALEPFSQPRAATSFPDEVASLGIPASNIHALSQNNVSPNLDPVMNIKSVDQLSSKVNDSLTAFLRAYNEKPFPNVPALSLDNNLPFSHLMDHYSIQLRHKQLPFYRPHGNIPLPSVVVSELPASNISAPSQTNMNQLTRLHGATLFPNVSAGLTAINIPPLSQNNKSSSQSIHSPIPNLAHFMQMKSMDQSSHSAMPLFQSHGAAIFPNGNAAFSLPSFNIASLRHQSNHLLKLANNPIEAGLPPSNYIASLLQKNMPSNFHQVMSSCQSSSCSTVLPAANVNVPGRDDPASEPPSTQAESKKNG